MYDPYAEFKRQTLSNKLDVYSTYWERPWIGVKIVIHSGAREDPENLPGLAHFVEHCLSENIIEGTYEEIKRFFESTGGGANFGSTSYLATCYSFFVPLNIFPKALAIFGSMLFEEKIEKNIENERKIIEREFNQSYPFTEKLIWDMAARNSLFKGHRLSTYNGAIGRPEGFLKITKNDLQSFYEKHYKPANISLVTVGGIHEEELIHALEKSPFGKAVGGERTLIPPAFQDFQLPAEKKQLVKLSDYSSFKIDQAKYQASWALPVNFPWYVRKIFTRMLNDLLFKKIRQEHGFAYSMHADYSNFQDVIEYWISCKVSPDAIDSIEKIVSECVATIPKKQDLFKHHLASEIQGRKMTDLSGLSLRDFASDDIVREHQIITLQKAIEELQKATFEQVIEVGRLLHFDRQHIFITHP